MKRVLIAAAVIIGLLAGFAQAAEQENAKSLVFNVTYGERITGGHNFKIFASPKVATVMGKVAEIKVGEPEKGKSFRMMIAGIPDNVDPSLIRLKIAAWETRYVHENGKFVKKEVQFIDQISRVKPGDTIAAGERLAGSRDVMVTIKIDYQK